MTPLPPDRSHIATEARNPHTHHLQRRSIAELVQIMNEDQSQVLSAMRSAEAALADVISAAEPGFCAGGRLIYVGAGTSGRLGVLDASEAPPTFRVPVGRVVGIIAGGDGSLRTSSEGKEDDADGAIEELENLHVTHRDTVIGIAAGGTTPYVRGALTWCSQRADAPTTSLLSCTPIDRPPGVAHLIVLAVGPEVVTGSTRLKAGTATKMALNTISTALMIRLGKVYDNLMVDVKASNVKLRDRAARIIATIVGCSREESFQHLEAADGVVKTAVIMARFNIDKEQAEAQLADVDGHLDRLLDP